MNATIPGPAPIQRRSEDWSNRQMGQLNRSSQPVAMPTTPLMIAQTSRLTVQRILKYTF